MRRERCSPASGEVSASASSSSVMASSLVTKSGCHISVADCMLAYRHAVRPTCIGQYVVALLGPDSQSGTPQDPHGHRSHHDPKGGTQCPSVRDPELPSP